MATVYIGSDHGGFALKTALIAQLQVMGHTPIDMGPETNASCDYPVYAHTVCEKVLENEGSFGVLICGTGIGMSMAANRHPGIRAALCTSEAQGRLTRAHNNANVLCLGERVTGALVALGILEAFMSTDFDGGRHQNRINLFDRNKKQD